jgi:UDP-glucose 4-epimerase
MEPSPLQNRKVLITGGAGFLGVHVAQELAAHGTELLLQDTVHKRPDLLAPVLKLGRANLVIGDLAQLDQSPALLSQLDGVDYVVHLGLRVPASVDGTPSDYLASNLPPFESLLQRLPSRVRGVCLASSLAVYGGPHDEPVPEGFPAQPRSALAETKLAMELVLLQYGQRASVPVTALRFSTLYGPGELNAPRAIPGFIRNLLAGQPPVIYGDGTDLHDFLFVADAARATRQALERMEAAAGVYNIGSGQGWTTRAVAEMTSRQLGLALPPKHMPGRGARQALVADIGRATARLRFQPETPLETGLAAEIDYFQANGPLGGAAGVFDEAHGLLIRPRAPAAAR